MSENTEHHSPCEGLEEIRKQLFGLKVGAGVAAFFISLFFVYVMSFFSRIDRMQNSLLIIQQQLTQLVEKTEDSATSQSTIVRDIQAIKERLSKAEYKLDQNT